MIDLLDRGSRSTFGIATVLDVERIPYRRIGSLEEAGNGLLVVAGEPASDAEMATITSRSSLILGGGARAGRTFARGGELVTSPVRLTVTDALWPRETVESAKELGDGAELALPRARTWGGAGTSSDKVLARASTPDGTAFVRRERCTWSPIDLGDALVGLLTEDYFPSAAPRRASPALRRVAESIYYALPRSLRAPVQRRAYVRLNDRLAAAGGFASRYPVDATGWLLVELIRGLVIQAAGSCVRVARWPAPYAAAATLTHDVEPAEFSYTRGLPSLLDTAEKTGYTPTLGLVAHPSARWLDDALVARVKDADVLCHGLSHRGENVLGREAVLADLRAARSTLEGHLHRTVEGYRSPRLDRSPDLAWALDRSGFRWDSSYPDVDRENLEHFGSGVRLNLPFRPPIPDESGTLRPSRCLELPLTAPDCIQPLFAGEDEDALRATIVRKAAFVRATGGCYVALVHAGVFDEEDAALRLRHLEFVRRELDDPAVWRASLAEVAGWWIRREAVTLAVESGRVVLTNRGSEAVGGLRVVIDRQGERVTLPAPMLPAGGRVELTLPSRIQPAA